MRTSRRTIASTLTGLAFAGLLLTGCAAGGSDAGGSGSGSGISEGGNSGSAGSSQTTEEACTVLKAGVEDTLTDLQAGLSELSTDPGKAAEAVETLAAAFEDTASDVTNEDVRTVTDDATTALNNFSEQITAYAANPEAADQTAVTDSAGAVQTAMTKLGTTCP
ncbi:hypothetical protein GCM10027413_30860 [Conyzicola nivalis]|uniref:Secreted protein n=1 Tax=Conyzicola nivalis TaxID=1477021 RepID=A0A916ST66_9MICO|nr:hypothetical protein [Conyzicola nivalis]GGB12558.1 hypothetical protein GCM10010979_28660 [Conyzicola nivalis]